MKKIISTGVVFIILLTLSISVFASPINIYDSSYYIDELEFKTGNTFSSFSFTPFTLDFGKNYLFDVDFNDYDPDYNYSIPTLNGEFTLSLQFPSTVFLACSPSYSIIEPLQWDDYRDSSRDFSVTYTNNNITNNLIQFYFYEDDWELDPIELDSYSTSYSGSVNYVCFDEIPAGTYTLSYGFSSQSSIVDMRDIVCGIYVTGFSINDPVGSFNDGLIDFSTAINAINSNLQQILDSPNSTTDEKILAVNVADFDVKRIKDLSDIKYNSVVDDFVDDVDSIIDNYNNGLIDIKNALNDIQMTYFDALSQSVTPEQGIYINTTNQIKLSELQLSWNQNYKDELDSVITDADLENKDIAQTELDGYLDKEHEVLEIFEEAEISSYLQFSEYLNNLKGSDVTGIKSIYNFFLTKDSNSLYYNFITVPFALGVFALLLSTSLVVHRGRRDG